MHNGLKSVITKCAGAESQRIKIRCYKMCRADGPLKIGFGFILLRDQSGCVASSDLITTD
jgi:hypothetical protein